MRWWINCGVFCAWLGMDLYVGALAQPLHWEMHVGEMRVLSLTDVARVAVGDGEVINAVTSDDKEVLVFARQRGHSSLTIWLKEGGYKNYQIAVNELDQKQSVRDLKALLKRIPTISVTEIGDQVIVEGNQLSASHKQQLEELKLRYTQLVDLSSKLAWEPMVLLDVQVLEVPRHFMRDLGVRWAEQSDGGVHAGFAWDGASSKLVDRPGDIVMPLPFSPGAAAGYFGINALLAARIQALTQTGQAVVLAQPQLLARSGATAEFLAGGEVPYSTTDSNGNASTSFKPYGVALKITPHIEKEGAVRSLVDVEVSSIDPSLSIPTGPSLKTRRASTEFNVQSGQTLVLAGFISSDIAENQYGVPGLQQLPIIGKLFSSTRYQRKETELAIFVTPTLIDAEHSLVTQRVSRAAQLKASHFEAPQLNVSVDQESESLKPSWSPWESRGSQWVHSESSHAHTP